MRSEELVANSDVGPDQRAKRLYYSMLTLSTVLVLIPIWTTTYLPLSDYANHLGRCYMLFHYEDVASFRANYILLREPFPNLACDLLIPLFMHVLDVYSAGKLFLSLAILMFVAGGHLLGTAGGRSASWLAALLPFFLYCSQFYFGLINFIFGASLFLMTFGLWLKFLSHWTITRFCVILLLVPCLYIAHLSGYAFIGIATVSVVAVDVWKKRGVDRHAVLSLLPLLPPLILYTIFMHGSGTVGDMQHNVWAPLRDKVASMLAPFISYDYWLDGIAFTVFAISIAIIASHWRQQKAATQVFRTAIIFFLCFLVCPVILYTSFGADVRFVLPFWALLIVSARVSLPRRLGRAFFILELSVLVIRLVVIEVRWHTFSAELKAQIDLIKRIPAESNIYPIYDLGMMNGIKRQRFLKGATSFAVIERNAYTAETFAARGQQPLVMRQPRRGDVNGVFDTLTDRNWDTVLTENQYFWVYEPTQRVEQKLRERCELVATAPNSELWVRKGR